MAYTVVDKGSKYFNTVLYTGNNSTNNITVGFQPDFTWIKDRSTTGESHAFMDKCRGNNKFIYSNSTQAERTGSLNNGYNSIAFASTGFGITNPTGQNDETNLTGRNYASWNWLGSNTTVTNTQGTRTSTVCVNTTSGFSVCTFPEASSYSGVQTFGHGLGVAPSMVIYRQQNNGSNWQVYHKSTGAGLMQLNTTGAVITSATFWPTVTSTLFGLSENVQAPTYTSIAYCFAEVKGYSKFGSYTGNGSLDGTFVYTGFTPAFVMMKRSDSTGNWSVYDNKRPAYNVENLFLLANGSGAEETRDSLDFLSNGFKLRNTDLNGNTNINLSGATYIYMCFASNPFVSSKGLPTTAR
jgi:hypothetical protein